MHERPHWPFPRERRKVRTENRGRTRAESQKGTLSTLLLIISTYTWIHLKNYRKVRAEGNVRTLHSVWHFTNSSPAMVATFHNDDTYPARHYYRHKMKNHRPVHVAIVQCHNWQHWSRSNVLFVVSRSSRRHRAWSIPLESDHNDCLCLFSFSLSLSLSLSRCFSSLLLMVNQRKERDDYAFRFSRRTEFSRVFLFFFFFLLSNLRPLKMWGLSFERKGIQWNDISTLLRTTGFRMYKYKWVLSRCWWDRRVASRSTRVSITVMCEQRVGGLYRIVTSPRFPKVYTLSRLLLV